MLSTAISNHLVVHALTSVRRFSVMSDGTAFARLVPVRETRQGKANGMGLRHGLMPTQSEGVRIEGGGTAMKSGRLRLGIVLSILWFSIFAIVRITHYAKIRQLHLQSVIRVCVDNQSIGGADALDCIREALPTDVRVNQSLKDRNSALFEAAVTTVLGWMALFLALKIYRWVARGFKTQGEATHA